jgi:hypothetical protein
MYGKLTIGARKIGISVMAAILATGAALAVAQDKAADDVLSEWLGKEFTVTSSTLSEHMPTGGKLTFVFDSEDNVVRVCTRNTNKQRLQWQADFATPCGVTMLFTPGTRFCTVDDVKAGNAEVLSTCHRLRSRDIAMRPSKVKGAVELNDMIAFLVKADDGSTAMSILVDSPARVTEGGVVIITHKR